MEDTRNDDGTFTKGKSGNPTGRPKGAKNKITLLKDSLELELRERSESKMAQVLDTAIQLALEGDRTMLKLLLELHMSKGTSDVTRQGTEKVSININGPAVADKSQKQEANLPEFPAKSIEDKIQVN
jgi:hypothetical protein